MKKEYNVKSKITLIVGLTLFISNFLLVALLFYNFRVALMGFDIVIDGRLMPFQFNDHLECNLLIAGIIITVVASIIGTIIVFIFLGPLLRPLKQLSDHMQNSDNLNTLCPIELDTKFKEVINLLDSYNEMNEKLRTIYDNQSNFNSYVAHEFKTPLAAILSKLDIYQKLHNITDDELVVFMKSQIKGINNLMTQLLDFVNLSKVDFNESININMVIEDVVDSIKCSDIYEEKNVSIFYDNEEVDIQNLSTKGSYDLLFQVIYNLCDNAVKYNRDYGRVFVTLKEINEMIYITIKDTGRGIRVKDKEHIFETFYRSERDEQNVSGSGIGLAFSKQVIFHHQGELNLLDSDIGACFQIILKKIEKYSTDDNYSDKKL